MSIWGFFKLGEIKRKNHWKINLCHRLIRSSVNNILTLVLVPIHMRILYKSSLYCFYRRFGHMCCHFYCRAIFFQLETLTKQRSIWCQYVYILDDILNFYSVKWLFVYLQTLTVNFIQQLHKIWTFLYRCS